jgi:adenylate cyclase class IV
VARNLEIKLRCDEPALAEVRQRAIRAGASPFTTLRQVDTYFVVATGRLKLRENEETDGDVTAELIAYRRADESGSRWSDYQRVPLSRSSTVGIKDALAATCGVTAVVAKRREVGLLRRTRIHLDRVEGLGCFVELETVAEESNGDRDLAREHEEIIRLLKLDAMSVVAGSYGDLAGH